jgi:AcrR family transcriptional regulator
VAGRIRKVKPAKIVGAAATVFAEKGFFKTVMADIASEAGIGKGTLYEYFRSKDDLFFAVFERFMNESSQAARESASNSGKSASGRLTAIGDAVTGSWPELKKMYSLTMEFWAAAASSRHRERFKAAFKDGYRQYRGLVAGVIREGIEGGEFRPETAADSVAAVLVGAWDALLLQAWFDDSFDPAASGRDFLETLLGGLRVKK